VLTLVNIIAIDLVNPTTESRVTEKVAEPVNAQVSGASEPV